MKKILKSPFWLWGIGVVLLAIPASSWGEGELVFQSRYTPFGEALMEGGVRAGTVDYSFTGQERQPSLSLLDYGARFYHPYLGIFHGQDPLMTYGESPYVYAHNNPLRYVDPTGCQGTEALIAASLMVNTQGVLETVQSAARGWIQSNFASVPMLGIEPNSRDIQNYHLVAAVGLFTAALVTAVTYEIKTSDPSGTLSASVSTAGKAKVKASTPYGSFSVSVDPGGVSASGNLKMAGLPVKRQLGSNTETIDTQGNWTVGTKIGKTNLSASPDNLSLVVQGTGMSVSKSGRTTVSFDAGGLGLSATVDPKSTANYVKGALDHIGQGMQVNAGGPGLSSPGK